MINNTQIIDAHCHLDLKTYGSVDRAAEALIEEARNSDIEQIVLIALDKLGLSNLDLIRLAKQYPEIVPIMSLHPHNINVLNEFDHLIREYSFRGVKLHPRFQDFKLDDERVVDILKHSVQYDIPVIIDSFPYYPDYYPTITPARFNDLASSVPEAKIVIAHACAHHVIDALFVAKAHPNVYLDFSFSILYFRGSSVIDDIGYVMKSLNGNRILYGSDYPDRGLKETLALTIDVIKKYYLDEQITQRFFYSNAKQLYTANTKF